MWHAERVPLSSDWWLKRLPSHRPENTWILEVACCCGVEGEAAELINGSSRGGDTDIRYLQIQWRLSLRNVIRAQGGAFIGKSISGVSQTGLRFLWIIHCNLWKHNPRSLYVAVMDLFMKTAIVLRSVRGSQTAEWLQVEVIVLWMQWNRSPETKPLLKGSEANWAATAFMLKTASFPPLLHYCHPAHSPRGLRGGWLSAIFDR